MLSYQIAAGRACSERAERFPSSRKETTVAPFTEFHAGLEHTHHTINHMKGHSNDGTKTSQKSNYARWRWAGSRIAYRRSGSSSVTSRHNLRCVGLVLHRRLGSALSTISGTMR